MTGTKTLAWIGLLVVLMPTGCGSLFSRRNSLVEVRPRQGQRILTFDKEGESALETALVPLDGANSTEAKSSPIPAAKNPEIDKDPVGILPPALQLISAKPPERPLQIPPAPEPVRVPAIQADLAAPTIKEAEIVAETVVDLKPAAAPLQSEPFSPIAKALQYFVDNQQEKAKTILRDPQIRNHAIVSELLPLLASIGTRDTIPTQEATRLIQATSKAQGLLRKQADLRLENLHYCKHIHGFGALDPLPANHGFQQAKGTHSGEKVQVYVEVENVDWHKQGDEFETVLSSGLEIHDSQGKVMNLDFPIHTERSKTPRNDYHLSFQFRVPQKVPAGLYTLWIRVEEASGENSTKRVCKQSIDFRVTP